jgi:hypothetical protein
MSRTVRDLPGTIVRLALALALIFTALPAAIVSAQDASTPMAAPTEISAGPIESPTATEVTAPTETPVVTETATTAPTETPVVTETPTTELTETTAPNSDRLQPLSQPMIVHPGEIYEFKLDYEITTARLESGIHFELRTSSGAIADAWIIEANGTGGFGALDLIDGRTSPGKLVLNLRITPPENAVDGDSVTLLIDSVVHTIDSRYETGIAPGTSIGSLIVVVPAPTPTPEPNEPPAATPVPGDPATEVPTTETPISETPAPAETPTTEIPASPIPATPQPETPASTPEPTASIDLSAELQLVGRKTTDTVAIGETRSVTLDYHYAVGFARTGTTIFGQMVNWDGGPLPGWSVSINGATDTLVDSEHLETGSGFDLQVTISVDDTIHTNSKARLMFTVSVDPVMAEATQDEPAAFTFAAESVETSSVENGLSETFEGPMLRLDGGFTTAVVTAPNNGLTCFDPSASYPSAAADSMIPGQIAQFRCNIALGALTLLPTFSGTATIQGANTAGWLIAATSQVTLLGLPIVSPTGAYAKPTVSFSGLGTLTLSQLLGAGGFSFSIFVKAPSLPLSLAPVNSVSIVVNTDCHTLTGSCNQVLGGTTTAAATLTATVRDIQAVAYGGGGLTDLSLLAGLGAGSNGLIFRVYCDTPATGTQVLPQEIVNVSCHIISLVNLNLLGSVASVSADVGISFTDTSTNWKLSYNGSPVTGVINVPLTTVLNAGVLSASANFTITLQYDPGTCVTTPFSGQPLNAINLTADYHLLLLSAVEVGISDGWASVPIQLEGASSSAAGYVPVLAASGVSFGTYQFSGAAASYVKVSAGTPGLTVSLSPNGGANCSARAFYVTAQFSALAGYSNPGHTVPLGTSISAAQISFSGSPTGSYSSTTTFTPTISGSPVTVISSTNTMLTTMNFSYSMAFAPPASQPVGYYLGTVTLTVVSGTPP